MRFFFSLGGFSIFWISTCKTCNPGNPCNTSCKLGAVALADWHSALRFARTEPPSQRLHWSGLRNPEHETSSMFVILKATRSGGNHLHCGYNFSESYIARAVESPCVCFLSFDEPCLCRVFFFFFFFFLFFSSLCCFSFPLCR